ncbi:v-SNARE family protein [Tieghemostelium lacteum]|uniref:V-SNARE family protein n=1 Tax=Tieghemostelium lacteum TaxID=361077 RepID=A0A152A2N8_TIELA|nr:v-SNARE family protein [Tieghemostelium lacteum]|eukprot:KYR00377.1 v-SNARE family protein [Tieghemostelium lacteum]
MIGSKVPKRELSLNWYQDLNRLDIENDKLSSDLYSLTIDQSNLLNLNDMDFENLLELEIELNSRNSLFKLSDLNFIKSRTKLESLSLYQGDNMYILTVLDTIDPSLFPILKSITLEGFTIGCKPICQLIDSISKLEFLSLSIVLPFEDDSYHPILEKIQSNLSILEFELKLDYETKTTISSTIIIDLLNKNTTLCSFLINDFDFDTPTTNLEIQNSTLKYLKFGNLDYSLDLLSLWKSNSAIMKITVPANQFDKSTFQFHNLQKLTLLFDNNNFQVFTTMEKLKRILKLLKHLNSLTIKNDGRIPLPINNLIDINVSTLKLKVYIYQSDAESLLKNNCAIKKLKIMKIHNSTGIIPFIVNNNTLESLEIQDSDTPSTDYNSYILSLIEIITKNQNLKELKLPNQFTILKMDQFDRTEQNFQHVCNTITRRIKQIPNFAGERKKVAVREAEQDINEAQQYLSEMEKLTQNHPQRVRLLQKIKQYQSDIARFKKEISLAANQVSNSFNSNPYGGNNNNPFSSMPEDYQSQYDNQRQHLLTGQNMLDQTNERLLRTQQKSIENEQIGETILTNLAVQGNQIRGMVDKLHETDDNVKSARKVMGAMARRVATNKVILSFIILILLGIIALIICLKWLRPK